MPIHIAECRVCLMCTRHCRKPHSRPTTRSSAHLRHPDPQGGTRDGGTQIPSCLHIIARSSVYACPLATTGNLNLESLWCVLKLQRRNHANTELPNPGLDVPNRFELCWFSAQLRNPAAHRQVLLDRSPMPKRTGHRYPQYFSRHVLSLMKLQRSQHHAQHQHWMDCPPQASHNSFPNAAFSAGHWGSF